jgi:hypothetical protein
VIRGAGGRPLPWRRGAGSHRNQVREFGRALERDPGTFGGATDATFHGDAAGLEVLADRGGAGGT